MTKFRRTAILGVGAVALGLPLVISANRLAEARSQLVAARSSLVRIADSAQRIVQLRGEQERIAEHKRPEQDVIARVSAALAQAGIAAKHFGGLRPESDAALAGTGHTGIAYRRQSVRVSLNDLSITQLGAFLSRWSATQRLWTPTRIELTHARSRQGSDRYDATILITATYLADGERR
ncbi:MAG: hypothetical protein V3T53_04860 [Phycisphaerales bacterium]